MLSRPLATVITVVSLLLAGAFAQAASAAQPHGLSFQLHYVKLGTKLTKLEVIKLTPSADLKVTVTCPAGKPCPTSFKIAHVSGTVQLKPLVGLELPTGTKIAVQATRGDLKAKTALTLR